MKFDDIVPIGFDINENQLMYFDKSDFKIDTAFSARKKDYPQYKTYNLKDETLPSTDLKSSKAIMIYHPTRCRSTVLLQDLFHTGYFATINEPCIKPTDENSYLVQDLIIKNVGDFGIPCIKTSTAQSYYFEDMYNRYNDFYSIVIIRDPIETLISNLKKMNSGIKELVEGKGFKEISFYAKFLESFYKMAYENREKLHFVSYKELAKPEFYKKILKDFNLQTSDEMHNKILEARKHDSHHLQFKHDQKDKDYSEDFKTYELQIMYIKAKSKTMFYYEKILEYIQ